VKICGNRRPEDIEYAKEADYIGIIVCVPTSPRAVSLDEAARLFRIASMHARTVAVTSSSDFTFLESAAEALSPDFFQFHFIPPRGFLREAKERLGTGIIGLLNPEWQAEDSLYEGADIIIADTFLSGSAGGTGKVHDWEKSALIRRHFLPRKFMLSGGLNVLNVIDAVVRVRPDIVDASSGLEEHGFKSRHLVAEFISRARSAE